eukprot:sb/3474900/
MSPSCVSLYQHTIQVTSLPSHLTWYPILPKSPLPRIKEVSIVLLSSVPEPHSCNLCNGDVLLKFFIHNLAVVGKVILQEPTKTSKHPIRTRYLGHVTGYQSIREQYFLILSVPGSIPLPRRNRGHIPERCRV